MSRNKTVARRSKRSSNESISSAIKARFDEVPFIANMNDYDGLKQLSDAIDFSTKLTADEDVHNTEVFPAAFRKLPNDVARIFLRSKQPTAKRTEFQLTDLKKFVTYERASIRFCRKMATTTEPSTTDVNKRKQLSSSPAKQVFMLHSVVGEDVSDSEDEDDEVFIDAKFGDVKVPLLWDPGARNTLLSASLF